MSPLWHLILASTGAALAFFLAGWLLRRPGKIPAPAPAADGSCASATTVAPEGERASLLAERDRLAQELAESERRCQSEAEARKNEAMAKLAAERDRETARAEAARLAAKEKTVAERLRVAEDHNRATLEQVESSAAAWDDQWRIEKAAHQQREQALQRELAELRRRSDSQAAENQKLTALCQQQAVDKANAVRAAEDARRALEKIEAEAGDKSDQSARAREAEERRFAQAHEEAERREREVRASLAEAAADWQKKLDQVHAEWQAKLAATEASWRAGTEAALRAREHGELALQSERQRVADELRLLQADQQRECEQSQRLALALRTAEEALAAEQAQAKSAAESLRLAEKRLADLDRLAQENAELRSEQARLADEAQSASGHEGAAKDAKVELAAAQAKLAEMGAVLEENRRLRDEAAELRAHKDASEDLERLTAAHKQLRLDAELMARRLQELEHDRAELVPLRAQAAEAASLSEEVTYLRRREKELEAQLYASGFFASREIPAVSGELLVQTPVSDMETNLDSLLGDGGPRTAVLADAQGFLIAGAGESVAQEGLAAFAAVAGEMVARARMLLPLAEVDAVRVTDANRMVLTCHLFQSEGQGLGVATLGPGDPPAENTTRAIGELAAIIAGGEK